MKLTLLIFFVCFISIQQTLHQYWLTFLLIVIRKSIQLNSFDCFASAIFHLIIILIYFATLTTTLYLTSRSFYNRIVLTNCSQNFCYSNDEKFRNHKQLKFTLNKFVSSFISFSSLIFLDYYDQTAFLLNKNCFLNNIFIVWKQRL